MPDDRLVKIMTDLLPLHTLTDATALINARLFLERSTKRQEWQPERGFCGDLLQELHPHRAGLSTTCSAQQYKTFVNQRLGHLYWRLALDPLDDLVPRLQRELDDFLEAGEYDAAFALLYYPHSTITVKPEVVNVDGRLFLRGREGCQEKTRGDRRSDVIRLVPVVFRISESMLNRVVRVADLRVCVPRLLSLLDMELYGQRQHARAIRHLGAQCLYLELRQDPELLDASPRGWPAWLNVALGHTIRSNQFLRYLL